MKLIKLLHINNSHGFGTLMHVLTTYYVYLCRLYHYHIINTSYNTPYTPIPLISLPHTPIPLTAHYESLYETIDELKAKGLVEGECGEVERSLVESTFHRLKIRKAAGPDNISARLLKTCASQLSHAFCKLFNWSLNDSTGNILSYVLCLRTTNPLL